MFKTIFPIALILVGLLMWAFLKGKPSKAGEDIFLAGFVALAILLATKQIGF